ncbi:MAG: amidohydrolase [Acidobacteria bacterium]|nr:MAG: amidohydrolase [Acidobacteriota bacterium]
MKSKALEASQKFGRGLLCACLIPAVMAAADADLILHNGKIVTVDQNFAVTQAVAVKDGKITRVGTDQDVLAAERGSQTKVLDLEGRTMLPGLIDSHVHPDEAGLSEFRRPLPPLDSFAAVENYIRSQAERTPKDRWIIVPRTFPTRLKEMRMPTRKVLDVVTDHPVLFDASYVVVANTLALKLSHIDRNTPNPPGGVIVKDANGEPNGILRNAESLIKGLDTGEHFSEHEKLLALEQQLRRYVEAGLTSIGDRGVQEEQIALYRKLKQEHRLPIRAVLTWLPHVPGPPQNLLDKIRSVDFHTGVGDEWLKFGAFKQTLDGGMTIGTAYQRQPYGAFGRQLYGITDPTDRGQLFISPGRLLDIMRTARDNGWQVTTHDQGGGAIDHFLDCLEALGTERPIGPTRSHVIHASFQSPQAIARMKKLGILADVQSPWLYKDAPALEQVFTYNDMRYFFPLRSYVDAGIITALGSDHMIGHDKNRATNPYNPFLSLYIAVTRKTDRGQAFHPEERGTRQEALKMHTIWAAYLQFSEKAKGSIEPGKLADLVVIDRDYLACPEDQIKEIEPVMTILDGKVVYQRAK